MTAEVAVINTQAIALAADSAMTLVDRGESKKAFTHANKIFELSKSQPIGIMIYGVSQYGRFPLEALIKDFRKISDRKKYNTVKECAEDFKAFLAQPKFLNENLSFGETCYIVYDLLHEFVQMLPDELSSASAANVNQILRDIITEHRREIRDGFDKLSAGSNFDKFRKSHPEDDFKRIVQNFSETWLEERFKGLSDENPKESERILKFMTSKSNLEKLLRFSMFVQQRAIGLNAVTGIFFCGYGEDEYLPSYIHSTLDGVFLGKPRLWDSEEVDSMKDTESTLIPFGQRDVIDSYLLGISDALKSWLTDSQRKLQEKVFHELREIAGYTSDGMKLPDEVPTEFFDALVDTWLEALNNHVSSAVKPIRESIGYLPKEEMAMLAEALVDLTSVKRRVGQDVQTVGGPVDVAVITKGDGFVWVKRKHYFEDNLNVSWYNRQTQSGKEF